MNMLLFYLQLECNIFINFCVIICDYKFKPRINHTNINNKKYVFVCKNNNYAIIICNVIIC